MKARIWLKRAVSMLTLTALLFSLSGCAMSERGASDRDRTREKREETEKETVAAAPTAGGVFSISNDPVIQEHIQNNLALKDRKEVERNANEFHFYIANTETMAGFVNGREVTQFYEVVQSAFDVAHSQYNSLYAHVLGCAEGSKELKWQEEKLNDTLLRDIQSLNFYTDKSLPEVGPLTMMFRQGQNPFAENGLTMIVSNFVEPSFDLNALAVGIEEYFDAYEKSAACVIGFRSRFLGELFVPQHAKTKDGTTFYIKDFEGEVPCYVVLVGPEISVRNFSETLLKYFDSRKVDCSSAIYTNSVYDQIIAPPLEFDVVADQKAKKATAPVLSSYNTGALTKSEYGNVYCSTYSSVETTDATGRNKNADAGEGVPVSRSTQITLISSDFNGISQYAYDYLLYTYDPETAQWEDAGKNALTMVRVNPEIKTGELSEKIADKTNVLLADGREEVLMRATLDFSDDELLSRSKIYRLEVQLYLNRENLDAKSEAGNSELRQYGITSTEYYNLTNRLCPIAHGHYIWTGTKMPVRKEALTILRYTPNLDTFLARLEQMETKYQPTGEYIQYLDFVFNLPDQNSKR